MCVFGDHGGGWDMDRRQKPLKLYLSTLGKPHYLKHKGEMACFLLLHLGCMLVHLRQRTLTGCVTPGKSLHLSGPGLPFLENNGLALDDT